MIRRPIRDLHDSKVSPTRFCDVVVDDDKIYLEQKRNKEYLTIPWEDVVSQVESAVKDNSTFTKLRNYR